MEKPLLPETPKLQVIGAGWGRTGTNSVKLALEKLLDGPCYHMFECVKRPDFQLWIDAYNGKKPEWDKIFTHKDGGTYKATLDYPACGMYRELMEAYPDAKVLLTVRDPEKWYDSVIDTIWSWRCAEQNWSVRIFQAGRNFQTQAQLFHKATMLPGVKRTDREGSIQSFKAGLVKCGAFPTVNMLAWVERVKSTVPPEKLLVFDVKEGWEPLCKFLNLPVPDEPFPNVNDRERDHGSVSEQESLIKDMNKTLVFCYTCNFIALLMALGVAYGLVRLAQFLA